MGLIRGVARTAAIAGTATAVSNRVSRRQANKWAAQDEQQAAEQDQAAKAEAYDSSRRTRSSRPLRSAATARRTGPGRHAYSASEAWRAQSSRSIDRGRVRRTEGEDPRRLTSSFDRASRA